MNRRQLFQSAFSAALCGGAFAQQAARPRWFERNPRVFLLDFQLLDPKDQSEPGMPTRLLEQWDTGRIVNEIQAAGADTLLVHAKCLEGNCYYNTRVGHKHSSIGDRDLMAEFSRSCRQRGLGLLYYVNMCMDRRAFERPEFRAFNAPGKPFLSRNSNPMIPSGEPWHIVCANGPYRQYLKDILTELSTGYDFDGYWLDTYGPWAELAACYCDTCRSQYRAGTGLDIPEPATGVTPEARAHRRWRRALVTKIYHEIAAHIRSKNPKLSVARNGAATGPWAEWALDDTASYVSTEFWYNRGYPQLALECKRSKAIRPDTTFEMLVWRFATRTGQPGRSSREYQVRSTDSMLTEIATIVAHGGFPQYYDQINPNGTLEPRSLANIKPAFAALEARRKWYPAGSPCRYAGVLWSRATGAFAPPEAFRLHEDDADGCAQSLTESHFPVELISERDVERRRWEGLRTILIPSAECLSVGCVKALDDFVRLGGGVVVTGRSSLRGAEGEQHADFALASLIGVSYLGMTPKWYGYLSVDQPHAIGTDLVSGFPMSVWETLQAKVKAHPDTTVLGTIVDPVEGLWPGAPPGARTGLPGLTVRRHGKGRVVYFPSAQGAIYKRFAHEDNRALLRNAALWAAGEAPPVTADAPETVQVNAWRDAAGRVVIHVVNYTAAGRADSGGALLHRAIPVGPVRVSLRKDWAGKTAVAQPGARALKAQWEDGRMVVTLDRVEIWEIVEVTL